MFDIKEMWCIVVKTIASLTLLKSALIGKIRGTKQGQE